MMTDQVRERLCEALREGNHLDVSCSYAGIGYSTFRGWLVAAQKSDADRELLDFLEAVTRAMHDFERFAVKSIKDQMPSDWRAAIAMLERRLPQKWGRRERVEVTGRGGGPISLVAEAKRALAVPEIRQALNQIAKYAPLQLPGGDDDRDLRP